MCVWLFVVVSHQLREQFFKIPISPKTNSRKIVCTKISEISDTTTSNFNAKIFIYVIVLVPWYYISL